MNRAAMDAAITVILAETYGLSRKVGLAPIALNHHQAIYRAGYLAALELADEILRDEGWLGESRTRLLVTANKLEAEK